jgi:hypothetical protein
MPARHPIKTGLLLAASFTMREALVECITDKESYAMKRGDTSALVRRLEAINQIVLEALAVANGEV